MGAPGQSPFDGNPNLATPTTVGNRPSKDDFNGGACIDVPAKPPSPPTQPTSACWNTYAWTLVSVGKAMAVGGLVILAGGAIQFAWTAANKLLASPYTVTKTATGKVQITWPANTFPVVGQPKVYCNDASGSVPAATAFNIANGIEVHTFLAGVLADAAFSVDIF